MVAPSWITTEPDPIKMPARIRPGWAPRPNKSVKLVRGWDVPEGMGAGQEFVDDAGQPRHFGSDLPPLASATEDFPLFNAMVEARKNAPPPPPPAPEAAPEPGPTVESQQPGGETAAPAESLTSEQPPATVASEQPQSRATPKAAPVNRGVLSDSGAATQTVARAGGSSGAPARAAPPPQGPSPASRTTTVARSNPSATQQSFVQENLAIAKKVSAETGIPYQLLLAIPGNETGWGKAMAGNNYFGIKGKNPKTGANTGSVGTWEVVNGQRVNINDTFRAYSGYEESARDFAAFLNDNPRYGKALEHLKKQPDDWRGFVREVHAAGYATDPAWSDKIINIGNGIGDDASPAVMTPQSQNKLPPDKSGRLGVQSVIDVGSTQIGSKYKWGGAGGRTNFEDEMANTDCSGFVAWSYQKATGHKLTAYTGSMWNETVAISAEEAAPGDLVMYGMGSGDAHQQHVGIYVGNGQFLHDSSVNPNGGVDITPLWKNASFRRVPVDPNLANYSTRDAGREQQAPDDPLSHWYVTVHGGRKVFIGYTQAGNTITDDLGDAGGLRAGRVLGSGDFMSQSQQGMGVGQDEPQPGYIAPEGLAYRPMPLGAGQDTGEEFYEDGTSERLAQEEEMRRQELERKEREERERQAIAEQLQRQIEATQERYQAPEPEPNPLQGLVRGANQALEEGLSGASEAHKALTERVEQVPQDLASAFGQSAERGTLLSDLGESASSMAGGVKEAVGGAFDALGSQVYGELTAPVEPYREPVEKPMGDVLQEAVKPIAAAAGDALGGLGETLEQMPPPTEIPGRVAVEAGRQGFDKGAEIAEYLQSQEGQEVLKQAGQAGSVASNITGALNPVTAVKTVLPGALAIQEWIAANKDGWAETLGQPVPEPKPPEPGSVLDRGMKGQLVQPWEQAQLVWEGYEAAEKMRRDAVKTALPPEIRDSPEGFALTEGIVLATDPTNALGTFGGAPKVGKTILTQGGDRLLAKSPEGVAAIREAIEGTTKATPSIAAHIQRTEKAAEGAAALAARRTPARTMDAAAMVSRAAPSVAPPRTGGVPVGTPEEVMAEAERAREALSLTNARTTTDLGTRAVMAGTPEEIAFGSEVIEALDRPYTVKEAMEILQTAYLHLNDKTLENSADVLRALQASGAKDEPLTGEQLRRAVINAASRNAEVIEPDAAPEWILKQTDAIMKKAGHPLLSTDAAATRAPLPDEIMNARRAWYETEAASQAARYEEQRRLTFAAMGRQQRAGALQAVRNGLGWVAPPTARGVVGGALGAFHEIGTTPGDQPVDYGKVALKGGVAAFATMVGGPAAAGLVQKTVTRPFIDSAARALAPATQLSPFTRQATDEWTGNLELAYQLSKQVQDQWITVFGKEIPLEEQVILENTGRFSDRLMNRKGADEAIERWEAITAWAREQGLIEEPISVGTGTAPKVYIPHSIKKDRDAAIQMATDSAHRGRLARNPMRYYNMQRTYQTLEEGMGTPGYGKVFEYSQDLPVAMGDYYQRLIQAAAHRLFIKRLEALSLQRTPELLSKGQLDGEDIVRIASPGPGARQTPRGGHLLSDVDGFRYFPELENVYVSGQMRGVLNNMMGGGGSVGDLGVVGKTIMDTNAMFKHNVLSGIDAFHIINEIRQLFATQGWNTVVGGRGAPLQVATGLAGATAGAAHEMLGQEDPNLARAGLKAVVGFGLGTAATVPIVPGKLGKLLPAKWLPEPAQGGGTLWLAFAHALDPGLHAAWQADPFVAKRIQRGIRDGLQMTINPDLPEHLDNRQRFILGAVNMLTGGVAGYQGALQSGASQEDAVKWGIGGAAVGGALATPLPNISAGLTKTGASMHIGFEQKSLVEHMTAMTFDRIIPFMKYTTYEMYAPKFGGRHAAEFANEVFGGQNILAIGRSRLVQDMLRLAILAPDWQEGWARLVGNGFFNWGKDQPLGTMSRTYWRNAALQSVVMLEGMNLALGGKWSWQNDPDGTLMVDASRYYDMMGFSRINPRTGQEYTPYFDILGPYRGMLEPLQESARWTLAGAYDKAGFKPERIPFRPEIYGRVPRVGEEGDVIPSPDNPKDAWLRFLSSRGGWLGTTLNEVLVGKDFAGRPIDRADDQEYQQVANRALRLALNMLPTGQAEIARSQAMGEDWRIAVGSVLTGTRPRRVDTSTEHFQINEEIRKKAEVEDSEWRGRREKDYQTNRRLDLEVEAIIKGLTNQKGETLSPGQKSDATPAMRKDAIAKRGIERVSLREALYDMAGEVEGPERKVIEEMIQKQQEMEIVPGKAQPADLNRVDLDPKELFRLAWNRDPAEIARLKGEKVPAKDDLLGQVTETIRDTLERRPGFDKLKQLGDMRTRWTVDTALKWNIDPAVMNDIVKAHTYQMADGKGGFAPPSLQGRVTSAQLDDLTDGYQAAGRTKEGKNIESAEIAVLNQQDYVMDVAQELGVDPKALMQRIKLRTLPAADTSPEALGYSHARDVLNNSRFYKYQNPDGSPFGTPKEWAENDRKLADKKARFDYVENGGERVYVKANRERDEELTRIYAAKQTATANRYKDVRRSEHRDDYYRWYGDGVQMTDEQWQQYKAGTLDMWRDKAAPAEAKRRLEAQRVWASLGPKERREYGIEAFGYKAVEWDAYDPRDGDPDPRSTSLANYIAYINTWKQDKWRGALGDVDPEAP